MYYSYIGKGTIFVYMTTIDADGFACLKKIALLGALSGPVKVSTQILGEMLEISQQTASRRLQTLEKSGMVSRTADMDGQYILVTPVGEEYLRREFSELCKIFGESDFREIHYMDSERASEIFSPVHSAKEGTWVGDKSPNVVIFIVESLAQEYIGAFNDYQCYTPYLDSLINNGLSFKDGFCNGNKSIDAMPSVLSSIPMMKEHIVLSRYSIDEIGSIAKELGEMGYSSAFFHGAPNGSMGLEAYANSVGFEKYFGMNEYVDDSRFSGKKDFDGTWSIWDEEFLQFYALKMSELQEPFITSVFTASSHHPFVVPERYKDTFSEPGHPMYSCIRYLDYSIQRFMETSSAQPWFDNTIFVFTADHTNYSERPEYADALGAHRVPVVFFDPLGRLPRGRMDKIAQQIDIMPTILGITGTTRDYIAFGKDLFDDDSGSWAVFYKDGYRLVSDKGEILFDGMTDPQDTTENIDFLKAFIQQELERIVQDELVIK